MADDITDVPFAPLGGGSLTTQSTAPLTPQTQEPSAGLESFFGGAYTPSTSQSIAEQTQLAAQKLQGIEQGTGGFLPVALATAAALSGNFGPALQLTERRRQAQIGQRLLPVASQIGQLEASGKLEEARAVAETAALRAGDNAPEVSKVLQGMLKRIDDKQTRYKQATDVVKILKDHVEKDDPRYKFVKALDTATKSRSDITESTLNNFLTAARVHTQALEGQLIQSNEATPGVSISTMPTVARPGQIDGLIADRLAVKYGFNPDQLVNVMNNQPIVKNGMLIRVSPELSDEVRRDVAQMQGVRSDVELGQKLPISPAAVEAARRQGVPNLNIAMGVSGMDQGTINKTYEMQLQREKDIKAAEFMARMDVPVAASGTNLHIVNPKTGQEKPVMSLREAVNNPKENSVLDSVKVEQSRLMFKASRRLNALKDIIDQLPSADAPLDRISGGVNRVLNSKLGLDPNLTFAQAMQAVVKGDVEAYFNTRNVSAERYADLTRALTSPTATKQGAQETLRGLFRLLQEDHQLLLNQGNEENIPENFRQPEHTQPGAPAAQPVPAVPGAGPVTPVKPAPEKKKLLW